MEGKVHEGDGNVNRLGGSEIGRPRIGVVAIPEYLYFYRGVAHNGWFKDMGEAETEGQRRGL